VQQQKKEDEDLARGKRVLRPRDAYREEAGQHRDCRADPDLHPAFLPEDEARFGRAAPHTRFVEVAGAPHGIHAFVGSTDRYLAELQALLARAGVG